MHDPETQAISFAGDECIAQGTLVEVARLTREWMDEGGAHGVLVFDATTSKPIDIDWRGTAAQVVARISSGHAAAPRGRGRPKLGVVGKEVTLLPRHWEWLDAQPGGASVTLRKLVEEARRDSSGRVQIRDARDAAYRFMLAMAGDEPGFEEATRALYAGRDTEFMALVEVWPPDIRDHAVALAAPSFRAAEPGVR